MPSWPDGTSWPIRLRRHRSFNWPPAQDNVGIVAYAVSQDGQEIARTDGGTLTEWAVGSWTEYTFTVSARCAAGNVSIRTGHRPSYTR